MSRTYFVVLLFSCMLTSATSLASVNSSPQTAAFAIPTVDYTTSGAEKSVDYIPTVHSADGLPICCSEAARALYLQNGCRKAHKNPCEPKENQLPSVLSLAALADEANRGPVQPNNPIFIDHIIDHPPPDIEFVLKYAAAAGAVYPESCFSMDKFVAKYHDRDPVKESKVTYDVFVKIKKAYEAAEKAKLEGTYTCLECLNKDLREALAITDGITDINEALKEQTFERFLHSYLIGGCQQIKVGFKLPAYSLWPNTKTNKEPDNTLALAHIKETIDSGVALGMTLCPADIPKGNIEQCHKGGHCVMITGYKKVCKADGVDCLDLVHVQNSWGADWEDQTNHGWVDAATLLKHADVGRSSQLFSFDP